MDRRRLSLAIGVGVTVLAALVAPIARGADPAPAALPEPTIGPLISGGLAQHAGTSVWTDYAYDDRSADSSAAATYPEEAAPGNAADLIQLQLRPDGASVTIRAVLETLTVE